MNIFKFVINPHDFGQSVENLFYLSFLIRDGKCAFYTDEDTGEPVICESSVHSRCVCCRSYLSLKCYASNRRKTTMQTDWRSTSSSWNSI